LIGGADMDLTAHYCPLRRDLEENSWSLTNRLSLQTSRLLKLIGRDHGAFVEMKDLCDETRTLVAESHRELRHHRSGHGC
jgi:hypothetical protein